MFDLHGYFPMILEGMALTIEVALLSLLIAVILGLIGGLLLFPTPDFSKSLLVGIMLPIELFPEIILQSLLFLSFFIATLGPAIVIMKYDSFKRW